MLRFTLSSLVSRRNKIYQPLLRIRLSLFHASSSWENSRRQNCVAASVSQDGKKVNLYSTKEGKAVDKKSLHVLWLRHRCHCSNCHSKHSGQTIVDPMLLTKDLRVQSAHVQGDELLVKWSSLGKAVHVGSFPLEWLEENECVKAQCDTEDKTLALTAQSLPISYYEDVMTSDKGLYQWLLQINQYGVSLLKNVPPKDKEIAKVVKRIGPVQETVYGEKFDVQLSEKPFRQAYTSHALLLHMDQGFYESTPGLQFLHCIRFDTCVEGGESTMLDAYPVVEEMKKHFPKQFNTLATLPVPFVRINYSVKKPIDYTYEKTIIVTNRAGEVVGMNWCPQVQGPIKFSNEKELEDFFEAYHLLAKLFDNSKLKLHHRLQPGDALTFNNRRFLHSRNAFKQNGGIRHLQGVYASLDDFRSRFITLWKQLGKQELDTPRLMFNCSPGQ